MTKCRHCGRPIVYLPGHSGRYSYTDCLDDTAIFGSGSECPSNERGHEPGKDAASNAWLAWIEQYEFRQLLAHHPELPDV